MKKYRSSEILIARERRGMIFLLLVVLFMLVFYMVSPVLVRKYSYDYTEFSKEIEAYKLKHSQGARQTNIAVVEFQGFDVNEVTSEELVQYGLSLSVADRWIKYRDVIGGFESLDQVQKIYGLNSQWYNDHAEKLFISKKASTVVKEKKYDHTEHVLFDFNPNLVTDEELKLMGFNSRSSEALLRYRNEGGVYYKNEDLRYLAGMSPVFYEKLSPFITIDTSSLPHLVIEEKVDNYNTTDLKAGETRSAVVDINSSNVYEWQMLKGVGPKYAEWIIRYRDKLGGFSSIDQISETFNLPDSVFQSIKPFLTISPVNKFIEINKITVDSLRLHPYVDWKQASIIVNYRTQHGPYTSADDLYKTRVFDTLFVNRIKPYLKY